jgi:hypothetical protein
MPEVGLGIGRDVDLCMHGLDGSEIRCDNYAVLLLV